MALRKEFGTGDTTPLSRQPQALIFMGFFKKILGRLHNENSLSAKYYISEGAHSHDLAISVI